jgi:hypothetical protein
MIVNPYGLTLIEWADRLTDNYPQLGRLMDNDWQSWGGRLLLVAGDKQVPSPSDFTTWREWAETLSEVL